MDADSLQTSYGVLSLLPSLIAIGFAFLTRQVFLSLFLGIWAGAVLLEWDGPASLINGLLRVADTHLLRAVAPADGDTDHISIVMFTLIVGGMIGIISANGGMRGVVQWLTRFADRPGKGQAATFGMGFIVFFDDYANTLIVGKTLRPLMDRLRVSREKLAFLVDATAAPLSAIALVTTWIGFQLSLIDSSLKQAPTLSLGAYEIFLQSLPYQFYPVLMLGFIALIILTGRDFGPMLGAERRARQQKATQQPSTPLPEVQRTEAQAGDAICAALPILVLIGTTIAGLFITGNGATVRETLGNADPFRAMLWASLLSLITAVLITIIKQSLKAERIVLSMEEGFKPMLTAVIILTFAWAIADINSQLGTANYIIAQLGDSVNPVLLPAIIFVVSAITAFATGSSWGTMGILIPLVIPLSIAALGDAQGAENVPWHVLFASVASIMAGSVWGDHCSPISDTTILSSLASDCPHMDHVRTQMPYALSVASVSLLVGILPAGYGVHSGLLMLTGMGLLFVILRFFGEKAD